MRATTQSCNTVLPAPSFLSPPAPFGIFHLRPCCEYNSSFSFALSPRPPVVPQQHHTHTYTDTMTRHNPSFAGRSGVRRCTYMKRISRIQYCISVCLAFQTPFFSFVCLLSIVIIIVCQDPPTSVIGWRRCDNSCVFLEAIRKHFPDAMALPETHRRDLRVGRSFADVQHRTEVLLSAQFGPFIDIN